MYPFCSIIPLQKPFSKANDVKQVLLHAETEIKTEKIDIPKLDDLYDEDEDEYEDVDGIESETIIPEINFDLNKNIPHLIPASETTTPGPTTTTTKTDNEEGKLLVGENESREENERVENEREENRRVENGQENSDREVGKPEEEEIPEQIDIETTTIPTTTQQLGITEEETTIEPSTLPTTVTIKSTIKTTSTTTERVVTTLPTTTEEPSTERSTTVEELSTATKQTTLRHVPTTGRPTTEYIEYEAKNFPPNVRYRMDRLATKAGKYFSYVMPADTFSDMEDGSDLRYEVTSSDGEPLKASSWLQFNPKTREFYGL